MHDFVERMHHIYTHYSGARLGFKTHLFKTKIKVKTRRIRDRKNENANGKENVRKRE